jgi:hypothetical protein
MKKLIIFLSAALFGLTACSSLSKKKSPLVENPPSSKDSLKFNQDVKKNDIKEQGFKYFNNERVVFINIHDYPDSAIISAKTKMNPPDVALNEARQIQSERAEILRQALESHCDGCENMDVITPLDVFGEKELNFFFDKIFLKQEVKMEEIANLRKDLAKYSVLVLVLSAEDYEKNRGFNKKDEVVSQSENELRSEVYVFHLNKNELLYRSNLTLMDTDYIFYQKNLDNKPSQPVRLKSVSDTKIVRLLNDLKYDDIYPYPLTDEGLTMFYYYYNQLVKNIGGEN